MKNLIDRPVFLITLLFVISAGVITCTKKDVKPAEAKVTINKQQAISPTWSEKNKYKLLPAHEPGVVLVEFVNNESQRAVSKAMMTGAKHRQTVTMKRKGQNGYWKLRVQPGKEDSMLNALKRHPDVRRVELNTPAFPMQVDNVPNDPLYPQMWGLAKINALAAWNSGNYGAPDVMVQLIDQPLNNCIPEMDGRIAINRHEIPNNGIDDDHNGYIDDVTGWNFVNHTNNIYMGVNLWHGQHTSGTILAKGNNSQGVVGVSRNGKILVTPFLGTGGGWIDDAIQALQYGKMMKTLYPDEYDICTSSNSWGGGGPSELLKQAIRDDADADIGFTCAAGNSGNDADTNPDPSYPASYSNELPTVFPVLASQEDDTKAGFSTYGKQRVYIGAPGVRIMSTMPDGSFAQAAGTSMACPHIAGAFLLMKSVHRGWTFLQMKDSMIANARKVDALTPYCVSGGVLDLSANIYRGVTNHVEPTGCFPLPPPPPPPSTPKNFRLYGGFNETPGYGVRADGGYFYVTADPPLPSDGDGYYYVYLEGPWNIWATFFPGGLTQQAVRPYDIYCKRFDDYGQSSPDTSNHIRFTLTEPVPPPVVDTQAPQLNGGPSVSDATTTSLKVSWPAATDNVAVTGYDLYRNGIKVNTSNITGTSYTDNGLSPGTGYSYYYTAHDGVPNFSLNSTIVTGVTESLPPPGFTITAVLSGNATQSFPVQLTYTASSTGTIASKQMERRRANETGFTTISNNPASPFIDDDPVLKSNGNPNWVYRLKVTLSNGQWAYSNEKPVKVNKK